MPTAPDRRRDTAREAAICRAPRGARPRNGAADALFHFARRARRGRAGAAGGPALRARVPVALHAVLDVGAVRHVRGHGVLGQYRARRVCGGRGRPQGLDGGGQCRELYHESAVQGGVCQGPEGN